MRDERTAKDSQSIVVRRHDLIKLFSLNELFTEIGKRLHTVMDADDEGASMWPLSSLLELRNVAEE